MTERERLEHYLDDFGARLAGAAGAAPPAPRRRARRPLALALGGAAAIAAVAAVIGASGERSLDPVAEARAALAAPGEIVYMKITSTTIVPGSSSVPPPQTTEQWSALDPPRWRFVQTLPRRGSVMRRVEGGRMVPITGRQEMSYGAGVTRSYDADRDTLVVTRGYRDSDAAARLPSVLGQGSGDPAVDLRSMLLQGTVSDRGEQRLRGRAVRRFVVEQRRDGPNDPPTVRRLVYDVDPQSFAPIEGRFTITFGPGQSLPRITSVMRVDAYERIPLDATSAKLLRIPATPRTKATFDTKRKLEARFRAWRARCRKLQNGSLACPPPPLPAPKPRASR